MSDDTCTPTTVTGGRRPFRETLLAWAMEQHVTVVSERATRRSGADCICPNGHPWRVFPVHIDAGQGCGRCRHNRGERKFMETVARDGGRVIGTYVQAKEHVEVVCPSGHHVNIAPDDAIRKGHVPCQTCGAKRMADGARRPGQFAAILAARGWVLNGTYVNRLTPVSVTCMDGHTLDVVPANVLSGKGCRICAGQDPEAVRIKFIAEMAAMGVHVLSYVNSGVHVVALCPQGHRITGLSLQLRRGYWACKCGHQPDRVYLVRHPSLPYVKVGIASGPGRVRRHQDRGWSLIWQIEGLDENRPRMIEQAVLKTLREWGFAPLRPEDVPYGDGYTECFAVAGGLEIAIDVLSAHGLNVPAMDELAMT